MRPTRRLGIALTTSAVIIVAGGSFIAVPFLRSEAERGGRSIQEVRFFSATPASYGDRHRFLATYRNIGDRSQNLPERELFPGSLPLALAAIGLAPPVSLGTLALMAGTAVAFDGSLGTNGLIYDELYKYVRPFQGMRVPARFGALVGTGLILLSGYGARRVLRLGRNRAMRAVILVSRRCPALLVRMDDMQELQLISSARWEGADVRLYEIR